MWHQDLGKATVKPRGILEHELGPTTLPKTYYTRSFGEEFSPALSASSKPPTAWPRGQSIFVRNNPHPGRVRHFKGLCDAPICMVQDGRTEGHRVLMSPPSGDQRLFRSRFGPEGCTRYSANLQKMVPAVGIVPITYAWRDELEKLAKNILDNANSGKKSSTTPATSGQGDLLKRAYGEIDEHKMLLLLCRLLRTNSIPVVQAWMRQASDKEKDIVLNMLHMAASGELTVSHPQTQAATARRSVNSKSGTAAKQDSSKPQTFYYEPEPEETSGVSSWLNTPSPIPIDEGSCLAGLTSTGRPRTRHSLDSSLPTRQSERQARRGSVDRVRSRSVQKPQSGPLATLAIENKRTPQSVSGSRQPSRSKSPAKMWSTEVCQP